MAGNTVLPEQVEVFTPTVDSPPCPLAEAARGALGRTGHARLRQVVVTVVERRIVLRGAVPSFYLKQLAQVAVMAVDGVAAVQNELQVGGAS